MGFKKTMTILLVISFVASLTVTTVGALVIGGGGLN